MEWADILNDWKCGGPRPIEEIEPIMGTIYKVFWCGELEEAKVVTPENIGWFRKVMNDPTNDVWTFEEV